ncbi:MAG TPA: hypothetical protein VD931_01095 [Baekduia sp.]|nr:hypothetical protein [Baekduia sp.]
MVPGNRRRLLERLAFAGLLVAVVAIFLIAAASDPGGDEDAVLPAPRTTVTQPLEAPDATSGPLDVLAGRSAVRAATSASGRRRDRVRVTVPVELRNTGTRPLALGRAFALRFAGRRVPADRAAGGRNGVLDLDRPLSGGGRREGDLRFELAGAQTRALRRRRVADLEVRSGTAPRDTVRVRVRVPRR